ncbi:DNA-binding protein [Salipiger mucosus]|uniref:KfrA protein n=1 Tax=Salipiger mucosus DSM 16094 TaxID=1123237 RepID=S9Q9V1_9RHOB|nr:DNA-binding protein [Salipiger mucosus]EPX76787.1 KfrA protein [Salipiger mucosus DSM 16094]
MAKKSTAVAHNRIATREKVFQAASILEMQGVSLTLMNVRNQIGGGGFNTISALLDEYRSTNGKKLPPKARRIQSAAVNQLWDIAAEITREEFSETEKALKDKLAAALKDLENARAVTAEVAKNADITANEHRRQISLLQGETQEAKDRADQFEQKARRVSLAEKKAKDEAQRADAAEQRAAVAEIDLEGANAEINRLKAQLAAARTGKPVALKEAA